MGPRWRARIRGAATDGKHARQGPGWTGSTAAVGIPLFLAIASPVGGVSLLLDHQSFGAVMEGVSLIMVGLAAMTWVVWFWLLSPERRQAARRVPPDQGQ